VCLCGQYESARSLGLRDCMSLSVVNGQELRDLSLSQTAIEIFPYSIVRVIQLGLERVALQSSATRLSIIPASNRCRSHSKCCHCQFHDILTSSLQIYIFSCCAENVHRWVISLLFFHPNFKLVSCTSLKSLWNVHYFWRQCKKKNQSKLKQCIYKVVRLKYSWISFKTEEKMKLLNMNRNS